MAVDTKDASKKIEKEHIKDIIRQSLESIKKGRNNKDEIIFSTAKGGIGTLIHLT